MTASAQTVPQPFELTIERPLQLAKNHELTLLRAAVASGGASPDLRAKLAQLLFMQDQFDEAIALLEPLVEEVGFFAAYTLAECYISRETAADDARAETVAQTALTLARNDYQRGTALAALGKALRRQGKTDDARGVLIEALATDPGNVNAYKRLAAIDLDAGDFTAMLGIADSLIARGVGHARLQVARVLALGKLGRIDEARDAIGLDRFLHRAILSPPPGWPTIESFNAEVKTELSRHPDMRYNRYGAASSNTWRIDEPALVGSVTMPILQALMHDAVTNYVAALDSHDTAWTRARPAAARLHNWCVMTDADGFEEWHVHQNGWLSGVYYVDVPPQVAQGDDRGGCIAFGLPDDVAGADLAAACGEQLVRPQPGLLMLFPSHTYHRTFAHGSDHRRICVAFDIQPRDPADI